MEVVGSEIGQKMRSAIKAKLTELGCYVDDELPDYVMVMVANKRTRAQMDEDLQLFLGDNTELFVNWLHQVLKKLQEVQVTTPLKVVETEKVKERSKSKERKPKEKKEKEKTKKSDGGKKAKKKEKEKTHKKKEDKKVHKEKKKSKRHELIRPNIPPLLMNMEKESEPSITDVFAGQILKNHGITLDHKQDVTQIDASVLKEKRPIVPIIDPASIPSQSEPTTEDAHKKASAREEQIKEVHDIEAKISGLKKKLADQLDTMSDDEDFLNIRTEAEELLNDFAEDVFQEISQTAPVATPPLTSRKSPTPQTPTPMIHTPKDPPKDLAKDLPINVPNEVTKDSSKDKPKEPVQILPQIELNLPKRPIRERLGVRGTTKESAENKEKDKNKATLPPSPERLTPERQPEAKPEQHAKKYSGSTPEQPRTSSISEEFPVEKTEQNKRPISKVSVLDNQRQPRVSCASVVRVRPRPRVSAPASNLLMKAVADAHKSLLNAPPKIEPEQRKLKRALVLPMRRCIETQKIVIQVPRDAQPDTNNDVVSTNMENDGEEKNKNKPSINITINRENEDVVTPVHITKVINNMDYVPDRTASRRDDTLIIETKNKQKSNTKKHRDIQFIVTMDGFQPNAFLAKKLMMEGLLDDDDELAKTVIPKPAKSVLITKENEDETKEKENNETVDKEAENKEENRMKQESPAANECASKLSESSEIIKNEPRDDEQKKTLDDTGDKSNNQKKRLSDASEESDTQVIIKKEPQQTGEKRKSVDVSSDDTSEKIVTPPVKKRKASPIVFNIEMKEKETERVRERTQSASSDGHVTITTSSSSHKFDSVPPLSVAERKLLWCRAFPLCRYGSACAFAHPRCKFAAGCTRRGCVYSHSPPTSPPAIASHVVPAANYKTISSGGAISICKYYPSCVNPACHFYHPKPCRYGKACTNKLECNFYHNDSPSAKWKYP
ncbi:zinc finger CCCH domain-containing protein 14 isoform X1 [Papilio machaon]|uniref:zinc finger CCCH domain-containing protein 14 isoform X1 n=1 Tax=Papilio machaon TaxID=76193 RepID=UPI001E662C97|nr:zinc finger CCCH domain-containing protein 14 isoform X1 [Papilio machaon]